MDTFSACTISALCKTACNPAAPACVVFALCDRRPRASIANGVVSVNNVRLTTVASSFDGNPNGPGDYSSSTPFGGVVYPFFADHRADFEVYTAPVQ